MGIFRRRAAWVGPPHDRVIEHAAKECIVCREHIRWHEAQRGARRYSNDRACEACYNHLNVSHGGR